MEREKSDQYFLMVIVSMKISTITPEKLATLGAALRMEPGTRVLDFGSGSGEMLCTWARDQRITGNGIDMSQWI